MPRCSPAWKFPTTSRSRCRCCAAGCRARAGSIRRTTTSRCASSATSTTRWRSEIASLLGQVRRARLRGAARRPVVVRRPQAARRGRDGRAVPALMELQAEHERLMQRVGLEPEGRKFTPHVTLARLRDSSSREVAEYLSTRGGFRSLPFHGVALRAVLVARLGRRRALCGRGGLSAGSVSMHAARQITPKRSCAARAPGCDSFARRSARARADR